MQAERKSRKQKIQDGTAKVARTSSKSSKSSKPTKPRSKSKPTEEKLTKYVLRTNPDPDADQAVTPPLVVTVPVQPEPVNKPKITSPIDIAIAKYQSAGWIVIKSPAGSINDFIAQREKRLQFIQVVTEATIDNAKYHGIAKNDFVQNAFTNHAAPVFAHVVGNEVTFEDVNTGNRVLVATRKSEK